MGLRSTRQSLFIPNYTISDYPLYLKGDKLDKKYEIFIWAQDQPDKACFVLSPILQ
jgi:hypothetical protein